MRTEQPVEFVSVTPNWIVRRKLSRLSLRLSYKRPGSPFRDSLLVTPEQARLLAGQLQRAADTAEARSVR